MEMPEERIVPLRRRDLFTERNTDFAIASADFFLNTPGSRSIALLVDCTPATHWRLLGRINQSDMSEPFAKRVWTYLDLVRNNVVGEHSESSSTRRLQEV